MRSTLTILRSFFLVAGILVFMGNVARATNYYTNVSGDASSTGVWWTGTNGTGTHPNFATATNVYIIQNGDNMTTGANWTITGALQLNSGGSLTTGAYALTIGKTTSITGTLNLAGIGIKTFTGAVTVNLGGILSVDNTIDATIMNSDVTVASGGTFRHYVNYPNGGGSNYFQINGNLNISGLYDYGSFTPSIYMAGSGSHTINTGSTSLFYLLIRNGNFSASGNVTIDGPLYASWNNASGSFHTAGQTVIANWGVVNAGGTLYIDGGSLTINGATGLLSGNTVPPSANGTVIVSSGTLTTPVINMGLLGSYTAAFTQTGGTVTTGDLNIGDACTFTETAGTISVNGNLNLSYSTSKFNCTTGVSTVNVAGDLNNSGIYSTGTGTSTLNIAGDFINNNTFTPSTTGTVNFNGAGGQDIGGSVSSTFNNLIINDAAGVTISKDQTVNNTLTLTSGKLTIGSNNLILGTAATAVAGSLSASNMIVADGGGEVRKSFTGSLAKSFLFPVGDNNSTAEYSPITISYAAGTVSAGAYVGIKVFNVKHSNNASSTDYLNRYWAVSPSNMGAATHTATGKYVTADIAGTESNISAATYAGSLPWTKYSVIGSNTITATGLTGTAYALTGISKIAPTVSITGGGITICTGSTTASLNTIVTNATGSITYAWSPATGLSSATIANPVANPASTQVYNLTVTDGNGFTGTASTTITVSSPPATPTATVTAQPTCATATGTITITAPTGLNYSIDGVTYTNTTGIFTGVAAGTYSVTARNGGGCISPVKSLTVNSQPLTPAAPTVTLTQPTCATATGTITITAPTGLNYSIDGVTYTNTTGVFSGLTANTSYNVTAKNGSGCISSITVATINAQPATPAAPTITLTQPTCATATGTITITAPTGLNYSIDGVTYSNTTGVFSGLTANTSYNVTAKNGSGCISAITVAVINAQPATPATPTASVTAQPTCATATGTITITAPSGAGITYSTDGVTYTNTTGIFTGMAAGGYNLTAKNSSGCISPIKAVTVNAQPLTPAAPTASVTAQPTCATATGTITITAPTGLNYSIDGVTYTNTTGIFTGVASGSYNVTAKNGSGCISAITALTVSPQPLTPAMPTASVTAQPTCATATGTITITAPTGAGMTYSTDGVTYTNTTGVFTGMAAGGYNLTVKTSSGCISPIKSVTVNAQPATPAAPTVTLTQPTCATATGTITITAPTGLNYSIDGVTYTNTTGVFSGLTANTSYNVTAKNGSGCISSITVATINAQPATPATPTASVTTQPTCATATGTITITAPTGVGMTYSVDGVTYTNTTGVFTGLTANTSYNVTAKNSSGCTSSIKSVTVNAQPATPATPTASVTTQPSCSIATGTITITAPTGAGMTYSVDGVTYTNTTGVFTGLTANTSYNVTAKNSSGCTSSIKSVTVNAQPATPAAPTVTLTQPTCATATGTITITAPTGLNYSIDGVTYTNTTGVFTGLTANTSYNVTAKNGSGCVSSITVATINAQPATPATPTASVTVQPTCATATGTITITAPTGAGITYSIDGVTYANTTGIFTGAPAGTYNVTAKNSSGCISLPRSLTVNAQPATATAVLSGTAAVCLGSSPTLTLTVTGPGTISGTLSDGTAFSGTAPTISVVVHPLTSTTYTISTLTNGTCVSGAPAMSGTAIITVTTPPSAGISYSGTPFCSNSGTAPVTQTGTSGGLYSISPLGGVINATTGTVDLAASAAGSYIVSYTIAAAGGCSVLTVTTGIVINPNAWTGATNTDWFTASNWAGNALPSAGCADVTILATATHQPTLNSGTGTVNNLIIQSGAHLTVDDGVLQVAGSISNSGTFTALNGSVELNGTSAQSIAANTFENNALGSLAINNTAGVSLGGALDIYSRVTFMVTGATFTTNDFLTIKSTATNTGSIGDLTGNIISGKATVERFVNTGTGPGQFPQSWQLLSTPAKGQSIHDSWQEGGSIPTGYGAWITGPSGTGLDAITPGASMKYYNASTDNYIGVTNTSAGILNKNGYYIYVRGDRTVTTAGIAKPTTLRIKGTLYQPTDAPPSVPVPVGKYQTVGNPYASAIDVSYMRDNGFFTNLNNDVIVWDPSISGTYNAGGYQTLSAANDYKPTIGSPSSALYPAGVSSPYIQSGQAFFMHSANGAVTDGSVNFGELIKYAGTVSAHRPYQSPAGRQYFRVSLYTNTDKIADGNAVAFDNAFANSIDADDALKISNSGENLGLSRAGKLLAVEARHPVQSADTIFYNIRNLRQQAYQLRFAPQNMQQNLNAFLVDKFLNTSTLLNLADTGTVTFTVTSAAASAAADRFMVVFKLMAPLPVKILSVNAKRISSATVAVNWITANELALKNYTVERSLDGISFSSIGSKAPVSNNGGGASYSLDDDAAAPGDNFYRIKAVDLDGKSTYSNIVKVQGTIATSSITVFPNPIVDKTINLQFTGQQKSNFYIELLSQSGQLIYEGNVDNGVGNFTKTIVLHKDIQSGIYQLIIVNSKKEKTIKKLIIN